MTYGDKLRAMGDVEFARYLSEVALAGGKALAESLGVVIDSDPEAVKTALDNMTAGHIKLLREEVREVVRGKWVFDGETEMPDGWTYKKYHCSACSGQVIFTGQNFCPKCGADMREAEETNA